MAVDKYIWRGKNDPDHYSVGVAAKSIYGKREFITLFTATEDSMHDLFGEVVVHCAKCLEGSEVLPLELTANIKEYAT